MPKQNRNQPEAHRRVIGMIEVAVTAVCGDHSCTTATNRNLLFRYSPTAYISWARAGSNSVNGIEDAIGVQRPGLTRNHIERHSFCSINEVDSAANRKTTLSERQGIEAS